MVMGGGHWKRPVNRMYSYNYQVNRMYSYNYQVNRM